MISRRLNLLDGMDFLQVQVNFFECNDKSKKFATGYPQEGLGWVSFQLVGPYDVERSLQVCEMIAFVMPFHSDIIDVAFYSLTYMFMEDRIHGVLIGCSRVLQAKGHYCVAVYSQRCPERVCFSSSGCIFI